MNSVSLIGRLGQNPQVRTTGGGKKVVNFSVAVDYGYGDKKITSWIPVVVWDKTAELAEKYLSKGSQVAVSGRLQQRSWEDHDGNKHTVIEVFAAQLDFLSKSERPNSNADRDFDSPNEDEAPF